MFGKKWLSGSGDTEQTQLDTLTVSTFAVTLTLTAVIPFFHRTLDCDPVLANQIWLQTDQLFRR